MDIIKARIARLCEATATQEVAKLTSKSGKVYTGQLVHYRAKAGEAVQFTIQCPEDSYLVDVDHTNALSCYVL